MLPLAKRTEIEVSDIGSYYVDEAHLVMLDRPYFDLINEAMSALIAANPEFEFSNERDPIRGGVLFRWRRRRT